MPGLVDNLEPKRSSGLPNISRINRRKIERPLPTSQAICHHDQDRREKEKAFKMKSKETVSANRTVCEGWKTHRFAPALAPLRCASPGRTVSGKKATQRRSVRLTKSKPYQRLNPSDPATDLNQSAIPSIAAHWQSVVSLIDNGRQFSTHGCADRGG